MSETISLCYGLIIEASELSAMMGISSQTTGELHSSKCQFCLYHPEPGAQFKFCPNCGKSLDVSADLKPMDVVELVLSAGGKPPAGISVFHSGNKVCICHEVVKGDDFAIADKPMRHFPWNKLDNLIESYIDTICINHKSQMLVLFSVHMITE